MRPLRLATRGSPLARFQAQLVADRLSASSGERVELVIVETKGDREAELPISSFGDRGAFTSEVERAVLEGRADFAVHSAKDLPAQHLPAGLLLGAIADRSDPRDALVGATLASLPHGATVATGAIRRRAQLGFVRPDLSFVEVRGNIATRIAKMPPGGAVVVALAALQRLDLAERANEILEISVMLPQVGQGAIAVRCREEDLQGREALAKIDDVAAHVAVRAERAFLARLGGNCDTPVGAYATLDKASGLIEIESMIAARDGSALLRRRHHGEDPQRVGTEVAELLLTSDGGSALLEAGDR